MSRARVMKRGDEYINFLQINMNGGCTDPIGHIISVIQRCVARYRP